MRAEPRVCPGCRETQRVDLIADQPLRWRCRVCGRDFIADGTEVGSIYGDPIARAEFVRRIPLLLGLAVAGAVVGSRLWGPGVVVRTVIVGTAMGATFFIWARYRPRSYGRFVRTGAAVVGGLPGEKLPWATRTRARVMAAIGVLGLIAAVSVVAEPGNFEGGRTGGVLLGAGSTAALVTGVVLWRQR